MASNLHTLERKSAIVTVCKYCGIMCFNKLYFNGYDANDCFKCNLNSNISAPIQENFPPIVAYCNCNKPIIEKNERYFFTCRTSKCGRKFHNEKCLRELCH